MEEYQIINKLMKTSVIIQNLRCGGCAHTITTRVLEIPNISNVEVDIAASKVSFNYRNETDISQVKTKLKKLGYPLIEDDNSLVSKAKSFASCATGKLTR